MNIPRSSSEQDDIVNSLNYEGIAVIELQFYHFFSDSDRLCWLCHRLNSLNDLAVMVISQPPGNNPSYYYRASPTLPLIALNVSRDTLFYTCNYNIRVTHKMVLLHIYTN